MNPITRTELYLAKIIGEDVSTPTPVTRVEQYLDIISGNTATVFAPITRIEHYLAKIAGADVKIPTPINRIESYLAAICGEDVAIPDPITRLESYLSSWAEAGSSLPDGIEKLSYIQTDGGSYIITPIYLSSDSEVEMDFEFVTNDAGNLFGCYKNSSADNNFSIYRSKSGTGSYTRYDGKLYRNADFSTARHNIAMNGDGLWVDGEQVETFDSATFTTDTKLYICALANSTAAKAAGKIYRFKVVGVFDGIPVKKLEDGAYVYGLYDKIGQVFYPSDGNPFTGE